MDLNDVNEYALPASPAEILGFRAHNQRPDTTAAVARILADPAQQDRLRRVRKALHILARLGVLAEERRYKQSKESA